VSWREFVASLVGSLAWPIAVVALLALLSGQLAGLLADARLSRLKVGPGGAELEWDRAVAEVAARSVRALPTQDRLDNELDNLERMATRTPGAAMQQAFALVERELRRLIEERNVDLLANDRSPHILIKSAYRGGAITKETGEALRGLVTLRDLAARDPSGVTHEKAADYLILVRAVLYALSRPPSPSARPPTV